MTVKNTQALNIMTNLFNTSDFNFFKKQLIRAGKIAMKFQNSTIEVTRKSDASIVTQADQAVQEFLIRRITRRYGDVNLIYEENFSGVADDINDSTVSIIIDPIDGTAMFSMYLPVWCVSIGIFKGYVPLYGFVYSPGLDMFFYNDERHSYLNREIRAAEINMRIDTETNIFQASEARKKIDIEFPGKVRNLGSTAIHACLLIDNARNRSAAFIGKSRLWDWAGAIPIVLKAGGNVKYINGNDIDYRSVFRNDCAFPDYVAAYNFSDLQTISGFFKRI